MKDVTARIMSILFTLFVVAVLGFMTYTAYSSISRVTDDDLLRYGTLIFFDVGALLWFGVFMTLAKGLWQRAFSFIGFLLGFGGTLALMASDIILGQSNVAYNSSQIYLLILAVVIVAAAGHASLIYAYKGTSPDNITRIEDESFEQRQKEKALEAKKEMRKQINAIQDLGIEKAKANMQQQANELAGVLAAGWQQIATQELLNINLLGDDRVIDGVSHDVGELPATTQPQQQRQQQSGLQWPWGKKKPQQAPQPQQQPQNINDLAAAVAALLAAQQQQAPQPQQARQYNQDVDASPLAGGVAK